jgi:hypothetical protein
MLKKLALTGATLAVAAVLATPAHAGTDVTSISLLGGNLDFATAFSASDFPATTLNGAGQTVTTAVANWAVNDARGTGLGWNVKVQATRFTDDGGTSSDTSDDKQLPTSLLTLTGPTVAAGASQSALLKPTVQPLTTALDAGAAVPVAIAAVGTGQGLWNFSQGASHLSLVIPPTAEAGDYSSTITTTLSSGIL